MSKITIPYTPRPLQAHLHESLNRFNVIVCHRRFGKTVFTINEIIRKALTNEKRRPQYAYVAPTMKQAKIVAWDYIKHYTAQIPGMKYNETELKCTFPNGALVFVLGAENPDSLRGLYLDGVVLDEVAQMPQSIWGQVLRPALSDRSGWAIFIGTPKGQNYFFKLYERAKELPDWSHFLFKASETKILKKSEIIGMTAELTEEEYEQEVECSFTAAVRGAYYTTLLDRADKEGRIKPITWEPSTPVITAWDLGINDKTCIWFVQNIVGEYRIIDYLEDSNQPLTHYANLVQSKPYVYDYHIMPHDAKQRSLATGKTRLESLTKLGLKCRVAPKLPILEGVNAVKMMLPSCYFDEEKCKQGLIALRNYRSEFNERLQIFLDKPRHDEFSHASDAFRYLATAIRPVRSPIQDMFQKRQQRHHQTESNYDPFDF